MNKKIGKISIGLAGLLLIGIGGYMAVNEISHYGWFLFFGFLCALSANDNL